MKNNFKTRSAFSLIEISIVILIIGILIAGVTQSSRLVAKSRFSNARTLTQSSPASSIKNLALWVESTSEKSIVDSETESSSAVSNWYDLNPQTSIRADLSASSTARPTYTTTSAGNVNSLPTLFFDGSNDAMSTSNFGNITSSGGATIFLMIKTGSAVTAGEPILSKRVAAGTDNTTVNFQVNMGSTSTGWQFCDIATSCYAGTASIAANTPYVVSIVYNPSTADGVYIYKNGVAAHPTTGFTTSTPNVSGNSSTSLYIGRDGLTTPADYFTGYIGEIIIFDRVLKNEERDSIESYLGQKWGLIVS